MKKPEEKFTPGPWKAGKNTAFATVLDGQEGKAVYFGTHHIGWANVIDESGEVNIQHAVSNAALMAAAPEMYALLDELDSDIRHILQSHNPDMGKRVIAKIDAVLRKARGEEDSTDGR